MLILRADLCGMEIDFTINPATVEKIVCPLGLRRALACHNSPWCHCGLLGREILGCSSSFSEEAVYRERVVDILIRFAPMMQKWIVSLPSTSLRRLVNSNTPNLYTLAFSCREILGHNQRFAISDTAVEFYSLLLPGIMVMGLLGFPWARMSELRVTPCHSANVSRSSSNAPQFSGCFLGKQRGNTMGRSVFVWFCATYVH